MKTRKPVNDTPIPPQVMLSINGLSGTLAQMTALLFRTCAAAQVNWDGEFTEERAEALALKMHHDGLARIRKLPEGHSLKAMMQAILQTAMEAMED